MKLHEIHIDNYDFDVQSIYGGTHSCNAVVLTADR